jgi:hypothetical protein
VSLKLAKNASARPSRVQLGSPWLSANIGTSTRRPVPSTFALRIAS